MDNLGKAELKSQKIKVGKLFLIAWEIFFILFFSFYGSQYARYKKVQDAGIATLQLVSSKYSSIDDRSKLISKIYSDIDGSSIYGNVAKAERDLRDSLDSTLETLGFKDLYLPSYFIYSSFGSYLTSALVFEIWGLPAIMAILFYAIAALGLIVTILYFNNRNSILTVGDTYVIYQKNPRKTTQVMIRDITSIETTRLKGLKLRGNAIHFTINLIKNGEELKDAIMSKKAAE